MVEQILSTNLHFRIFFPLLQKSSAGILQEKIVFDLELIGIEWSFLQSKMMWFWTSPERKIRVINLFDLNQLVSSLPVYSISLSLISPLPLVGLVFLYFLVILIHIIFFFRLAWVWRKKFGMKKMMKRPEGERL